LEPKSYKGSLPDEELVLLCFEPFALELLLLLQAYLLAQLPQRAVVDLYRVCQREILGGLFRPLVDNGRLR
jgi:hypothetical protein